MLGEQTYAQLDRVLADLKQRGLPGDLGAPALLRAVMTGLHETAILILDLDFRYLFAWAPPYLNDRYGYDVSQLIGQTPMAVYPPGDAEERMQKLREMLATGVAQREEYGLDLPGGRFWHDITISPMRDERGEIQALLCVVRDVTARKRQEEKEQELVDLYKAVVEQSVDAIVIHRDKEIIYANPALEKLAGVEPGALTNRNVLDFIPPADRVHVARRMSQVLECPEGIPPSEDRLLKADGSAFWAEVQARMVIYEGRPANMVLIRDISERKRAEQEKRRLDERIQQAQKLESLANLARGVAHDFNNLLLGVLGHASLLLDELPVSAPERQRVKQIEKSALSAAELTRQLLSYSGGGQMIFKPVQLNELIRETAELLRVNIPAQVKIDFRLGEMPPLLADGSQLRQVVMNLLLNGAEAIGPKNGLIQIETGALELSREELALTYLADELPAGRYQRIEVSDDGAGIAPELMTKIFEPFFSTKFVGRGLGLAAVMGIVRAHHGALQVESRAGEGSRFRVFLPERAREPNPI